MEPHQRQFSTQPGPSGPAGIEKLTQILRTGRILPTLRGNPRIWGPGKGDYEHEVLIWSRSLSPLSLRDISLPLLAFGHFPLIGGIGPLIRGVGPGGVLVTLPPGAKPLAARRRRNSPRKPPNRRAEVVAPYKGRKPAPSSVWPSAISL